MRTVSIKHLIDQLADIRHSDSCTHAHLMAFMGYIAACWHLDAISYREYKVLLDIGKNAHEYRKAELAK